MGATYSASGQDELLKNLSVRVLNLKRSGAQNNNILIVFLVGSAPESGYRKNKTKGDKTKQNKNDEMLSCLVCVHGVIQFYIKGQ